MSSWTIALLLLAFAPTAAAEELVAFPDPTGDVQVASPATVPAPVPLDPGVDIVEGSLALVGDAFEATIAVADLDAVATTDAGVFPDTMFLFRWTVEGTQRPGAWLVRADYQPMNDPQWRFWGEGPCLDGDDSDGCAGDQRDIHDGMEGWADFDEDAVTIRVPLAFFGDLDGASFGSFWAEAYAVWPSYPVYIGDDAEAEEGAVVAFGPGNGTQEDGGEEEGAAATGGSGGGNASGGSGGSNPGSGSSGSGGPGSPGEGVGPASDGAEKAGEPGGRVPAEDAAGQEAPGAGLLALLALAGLAALRRR